MHIGVVGGVTGILQKFGHRKPHVHGFLLDFRNAFVQPLAPLHRRAHDAACRCGEGVVQFCIVFDFLPQLRLAGIRLFDGAERFLGVFLAEFVVIFVVVAHDLSPVSP